MRKNKKRIAYLTPIATVITACIPILKFATFGFAALVAVAVFVMLVGACLIMHAYNRLCLPSELKTVRHTIARIRKEYLADCHLRPMWPRKYEQLCFCLQCHILFWNVRMLHPGLGKVLKGGAHLDSEGIGLTLENTLANLGFCLTKDSLIDAVVDWAAVGEDESSPAMGINSRGEDLEPDYSIRNKRCLSGKILDRIETWFGNYGDGEPKPVSILLIGANDRELTRMIIEGIRDYRKCSNIRLSMTGMTKMNTDFIRSRFVGDDESGNADRVYICQEQDRYDIIIVTHYYQHHCEECFRRELPAYSSRLDANGIMVWLSAISRTDKHDEYVCEGCTPMNPILAHDGADESALYAEVGKYPAPRDLHYIQYSPIYEFSAHRTLLGDEFPRTFFVSKEVLAKRGMAEIFRSYLLWECEMDERQKRRGSLMFRFRESNCVTRPLVERQEIPEIAVESEIKSVSEAYGISSYVLLTAVYKDTRDKIYFVITTGTDQYVWNNGRRMDEERVTIYPAVRYDLARRDREQNLSIREQILKCIKKWKGASYDCRYADLLQKNPCAKENGDTVWRLHTHIKDVDLNDYMIVVRDVGNAASESFYIAAFPTKRYLTAHGFAKLLGRMNRFKLMRSSLPESNDRGFRPTLACSATWLCSYRNLKHAFRGAGLDIDFESCYFHKCYGSLPKNSGEEKRLIGFDVALTESQVSIAKDKAFNKLGLQDRLRLLETMNVHDLLLFATKSPSSRLHRLCRGI